MIGQVKEKVYDLLGKDNSGHGMEHINRVLNLSLKFAEKEGANKDIVSNTVDGTKEVEVEVDDFDLANEFLERIGFVHRSYQENVRIQYILDGVEVDLDFWPMIPIYMEIEGKNEEEVTLIKEKLIIDDSKVTFLNCDDIYKEIYGIDISEIKELKF